MLLTALGLGDEAPRVAAATAIAVQIPLGFAEGLRNRRLLNPDFLVLLAPAAIIGTVIGVLCNDMMTPPLTLLAVTAGTALVAIVAGLGLRGPKVQKTPEQTPRAIAITLQTLAVSAFAVISGSGIRIMMPTILARGLEKDSAAETAAIISFLFSAGALAGALLSATPEHCRGACAGTLFLPAVAAIAMAAILAQPLGARVALKLTPGIPAALFAFGLAAASTAITISTTSTELLKSIEQAATDAILAPLCDAPPKPSMPTLDSGTPPFEH